MTPVEIVLGMWGGVLKENSGEDEFKYDILMCCKNTCKGHKVTPPCTIIK
jgi:hypothetical protein